MPKITQKYREHILKRLSESAEVKKRVAEECMESILKATYLIIDTFKSGGKVLLCGNGGSAADCQHMATELVNTLNKDFFRPTLPAFALTTDTSVITSFANDFGFDGVFERQVQGLGKPNDLLIGISTSGNSKNVIRAMTAANGLEMRTLALTGNSGKLREIANVAISVPSNNTQYIQESHIAIEHILCEIVENHLFGAKKIRYGNK